MIGNHGEPLVEPIAILAETRDNGCRRSNRRDLNRLNDCWYVTCLLLRRRLARPPSGREQRRFGQMLGDVGDAAFIHPGQSLGRRVVPRFAGVDRVERHRRHRHPLRRIEYEMAMLGLGCAEHERLGAAPPLRHGFGDAFNEVGHAGFDTAECRRQFQRHRRPRFDRFAGHAFKFRLHRLQSVRMPPFQIGDARLDLARHPVKQAAHVGATLRHRPLPGAGS